MPHYNSYTDKELIHLLNEGDVAAFTEIYARFYGVLYRHAARSLADREEIKDMLQELFSYIWNNRASMNPSHNLAAYLYTAVRYKLLNNFKHSKIKKTYIASLQNFMDLDKSEADEAIRTKQLKAIIEAEVAKLPAKMRMIFEMSRHEHCSHQEIADKLEISVLTVRKQVNNSLKVLKLKLKTKVFTGFF